MLGIALQSVLPPVPMGRCVLLAALMVGLLLPILWRGSRSSTLFSLQLSVVCVALGFTLATVRQPTMAPKHYARHGLPTGQMAVQLKEIPHQTAKSIKVQAEVLWVQDSTGWRSTSGTLMLFLARDSVSSQLAMGDRLLVSAPVRRPSASENPHQFDYRRYLLHKGILGQCYAAAGQWLQVGHEARGLMALLSRWRLHLLQVVEQADLSPAQQGMAEALLLGWKDNVDDESYTRFQTVGIAHLLCVSGLHVGIVAGLLGWCFSWLACWRRGYLYKGLVQLTGLWLFVALSGMAPSAVRAGIMFSCMVIGKLFFSSPPTLNSVGVSALLLLLIRPMLLFDVGFQLSYAAVVGIVTLCPALRIEKLRRQDEAMWTPRQRWRRRGRRLVGRAYELLCVTTAAQLATLPFTLYYFHQFSPWFFVANMIIVPFATVLLAGILIMLLLAWWPTLFGWAAAVVGLELRGVEAVTAWVSRQPCALISHIYCDDLMLALLLAVVILCCVWAASEKPRHRRYLAALFVLLSVLAVYTLHCRRERLAQRQVVCYNVKGRTVLEVMQGRSSVVYCDSLTLAQPAAVDYQTENNAIFHQLKHRRWEPLPSYIALDTLRLAVVTRGDCDSLRRQARLLADAAATTTVPPLQLHYILLADHAYISLDELSRLYRFDGVVLASSLSQRRRNRYLEQCRQARIPCHDVAGHGAWEH